MDIYFYNNHSPANVVRKKLDNETVISGTLKEDIEIINPELLISKQVFTFNYCYIPKLKQTCKHFKTSKNRPKPEHPLSRVRRYRWRISC